MYAGHLDLNASLLWTVDDALSRPECLRYVERIRGSDDAEVAPIVGHDGQPAIDLPVRNNTRVMWDDAAEANRLLKRVEGTVPRSLLGMTSPARTRAFVSIATRLGSATACTGTRWSSSPEG